MMMFDGHFSADGRLNGSTNLQRYEAEKDETPLRHAQAEIWHIYEEMIVIRTVLLLFVDVNIVASCSD